MSAPVPMKDLARVLLPYGSLDGGRCMLTVYFDDSGTHDDSDVVLWAGFAGTIGQWDEFSRRWSEKLKAPSPGRTTRSLPHDALPSWRRGLSRVVAP